MGRTVVERHVAHHRTRALRCAIEHHRPCDDPSGTVDRRAVERGERAGEGQRQVIRRGEVDHRDLVGGFTQRSG